MGPPPKFALLLDALPPPNSGSLSHISYCTVLQITKTRPARMSMHATTRTFVRDCPSLAYSTSSLANLYSWTNRCIFATDTFNKINIATGNRMLLNGNGVAPSSTTTRRALGRCRVKYVVRQNSVQEPVKTRKGGFYTFRKLQRNVQGNVHVLQLRAM